MNTFLNYLTYYIPEDVLTNEQLKKEFPGWNVDELYHTTGVAQRHIAPPGVLPSDMAVKAAEKLFLVNGIDRQEIDFIIFCTQSSDYYLPTTACIIQDRLGLKNFPGAVDINQGCTGYIYGLALADGLVQSGAARHVLLLTAETATHYIYHKDRSLRFVFGDGASASVITSQNDCKAMKQGKFSFGSDGKGYNKIMVKYGGARYPALEASGEEYCDEYGNIRTERNMSMDGNGVFLFTVATVPKMVKGLLAKSNLKLDEIDLFVFHQASRIVLDTLRSRIGIPEEKMIFDIANYGNTSSSSIPIALTNVINTRSLKKGDRIMLVAFGVGLSWAGTILTVQ